MLILTIHHKIPVSRQKKSHFLDFNIIYYHNMKFSLLHLLLFIRKTSILKANTFLFFFSSYFISAPKSLSQEGLPKI